MGPLNGRTPLYLFFLGGGGSARCLVQQGFCSKELFSLEGPVKRILRLSSLTSRYKWGLEEERWAHCRIAKGVEAIDDVLARCPLVPVFGVRLSCCRGAFRVRVQRLPDIPNCPVARPTRVCVGILASRHKVLRHRYPEHKEVAATTRRR